MVNFLLDATVPFESFYTHNQFSDHKIHIVPPNFHLFDIKSVDVVLISNFRTILGLPYIIDQLKPNCKIYATNPTMEIGHRMMLELIEYDELNDVQEIAEHEAPVDTTFKKSVFSKESVDAVMAKVQPISYNQVIPIFGEINIVAKSSGYSIGSSNFILTHGNIKVVYMSSSCTAPRHPSAIDFSQMEDADAFIFTDINTDNDSTRSFETFKYTIQSTIKNGGDIMIPCYSAGILFDLIEIVRSVLTTSNLSSSNMFVVSPIANFTLKYADICAEWISEKRQSKSFEAINPFQHETLLRGKNLFIFNEANDAFSKTFHANHGSPNIIFVSHPAMRFGHIKTVLRLLDNPKNALVLVEPDFMGSNLEPLLQPLFEPPKSAYVRNKIPKLKVNPIPYDVRLDRVNLCKIISKLRPKCVIAHKSLVSKIQLPCKQIHSFGTSIENHVVHLPLKRKAQSIIVSHRLAKRLRLNPHGFATVQGLATHKNGRITLDSTPSSNLEKSSLIFGGVAPDTLYRTLLEDGHDVTIESNGYEQYKLTIDKEHIIYYGRDCTSIECHHEALRTRLYNRIVSLFDQYS